MAGFILMTTVWHPCRDKTLQCQLCSENQIHKCSKYGYYVLSSILGFTTLGVLHKYGRVPNYNLFLSLFLQVQHYILGEVNQSYLCNV